MSQATSENAATNANRGVPSYKQLAGELDATQKKLRAVIALAEKAKLTHAQTLVDTIEEMKKKNVLEWERLDAERAERERTADAGKERQRAEDAERAAREADAAVQKRVSEIVARTTVAYEAKFNELRVELMVAQRAHDDLAEQHAALLDWQKSTLASDAQWQEQKKAMREEIEAGRLAEENLARYKNLLKFMSVHKWVKDSKLKKRLLPLHTGCSNLIALILQDSDLRDRLLLDQPELARWVADAHAIERSEGIASQLPNTTGAQSSTGGGGGGGIVSSSSQRAFMMSTNVDYLVASLIEVEHVLATVVAAVLRFNTHFKSTSAGFFERNSALTAYAMAIESECRDTKDKAARTQSQLNSTLALLSRLEVKYSQVSRRLGKDDRMLAQRYLQRHGITTTTTDEGFEDRLLLASGSGGVGGGFTSTLNSPSATTTEFGSTLGWAAIAKRESRREARKSMRSEEATLLLTSSTFGSSQPSPNLSAAVLLPPETAVAPKSDEPAEDLSMLSPRALHRKLYPHTPTTGARTSRRRASSDEPASTSPPQSDSPASLTTKKRTSGAVSARPSRSREPRPATVDTLPPTVAQTPVAPRTARESRSQSRPDASPSRHPARPSSRVSSHHVPSAASASIAYSSSAFAAGFNLATSPPPTVRHPMAQAHRLHGGKGTEGCTVRRKRKPHDKKFVDVYDTSSDEEFTVRPVSYTPPPSGAAIRAFDFVEGDTAVKGVDGGLVEIVPTITELLLNQPSNLPRRLQKQKKDFGSQEEKEGHDADSSDHLVASLVLPPVRSESDEKEAATVASRPHRVTNASLIPKGSTTAWSNKLAAKEQERAHAAAGGDATTNTQATSGKSPYQESASFGGNSRSSSISFRPSSARSAHADPVPTKPTGPRSQPSYAASTRTQRKSASTPAAAAAGGLHDLNSAQRSKQQPLKPVPPTTSKPPPAAAVATAKPPSTMHVLNRAPVVLSPLPARSRSQSQTRTRPATSPANSSSRTASTKKPSRSPSTARRTGRSTSRPSTKRSKTTTEYDDDLPPPVTVVKALSSPISHLDAYLDDAFDVSDADQPSRRTSKAEPPAAATKGEVEEEEYGESTFE